MAAQRSHSVRRWIAAVVAIFATLVMAQSVQPARAAELLMFEQAGCPWCERWHAEVGIAYPKTAEGRRAPLRRLDISQSRRADVVLAGPVTASPTFVLVDNGQEVGRITGYPGADFFWGLLDQLLSRLDSKASTSPVQDNRVAVHERWNMIATRK